MSYEMSSDEMPSEESSNHLDRRSRPRIAGFAERGSSPRDAAARLLALARDENLTNALRRSEDAFNEDVLPLDARLREPREFYATGDNGRLPCSRKRAKWKQNPPRTTFTSHAHAAT